MEHRKGFLKGALCGALVMLGVLMVAGIVFVKAVGIGATVDQKTETKLDVINTVIDKYYLYSDGIDDKVMQSQILKGYVNGLGDPYSVYYTAEETQKLMESVSGEFSGIGVVVSQDVQSKMITFVTVYDNSPAKEAGLLQGDILYKINGEDITGQDLNEVVSKLKGEEGTEVTVTVVRGKDLEEVTASITRRKIQAQTVFFEMKDEQIGYIRISQFEEVTTGQFETALKKLQEQGMQAMVVDLRANPGGNLSTVCDILDMILPEGTIVYTKDKNGKKETYTSDEEQQLDIPMAVLIDGNSASASEIFAGAVKDFEWGTLIGTTTYGKGIVQQLFPLMEGACLKLTISEYFTKSGERIHEKGVSPHVEVEYVYNEDNPKFDNQLEKAMEVLYAEIRK